MDQEPLELIEAIEQELERGLVMYPEDIFLPVDLGKVRALLEANGMTLDGVSAAIARNLFPGWANAIRDVIRETYPPTPVLKNPELMEAAREILAIEDSEPLKFKNHNEHLQMINKETKRRNLAIQALRFALASYQTEPPCPGLIEAVKMILPRLESMVSSGPDCDCDTGHICGWPEFKREVSDLHFALTKCQTEPPHSELVGVAREAVEVLGMCYSLFRNRLNYQAEALDCKQTAKDLRSALALCQAEPPPPGLMVTARKAKALLLNVFDLLSEGQDDPETGLISVDGITSDLTESLEETTRELESALADCEKWERVTHETLSCCECNPPCHGHRGVFLTLNHHYPNAEVWRKRDKKGEKGE